VCGFCHSKSAPLDGGGATGDSIPSDEAGGGVGAGGTNGAGPVGWGGGVAIGGIDGSGAGTAATGAAGATGRRGIACGVCCLG
jgi:hypothetical protein